MAPLPEPDELPGRVAAWLGRARPEWSEVDLGAPSRPSGGGLSSRTLLFDATWVDGGARQRGGVVLRLPPEGRGLFPEYDLEAQARTLHALAATTAVPVPEVLAYESDPSLLGAPFLAMARVPGRIPTDQPSYVGQGWVRDLPPEGQRALQTAYLDVLAEIHALDWRTAGLGFLDRPEHGSTGLVQDVGRWAAYVEWAADGEHPGPVAQGLAWCAEHRPDPEPAPALLWGDARIPNCVFGDDLSVAAVLDWEMAELGPPEVDLGWHLAMHRMSVHFADGDLPGFRDRRAFVADYEARAGRPMGHLRWYEVWAAVRSAAIMLRLGALLHEARVLPDLTFCTRNPSTALLRDLLEEAG